MFGVVAIRQDTAVLVEMAAVRAHLLAVWRFPNARYRRGLEDHHVPVLGLPTEPMTAARGYDDPIVGPQ